MTGSVRLSYGEDLQMDWDGRGRLLLKVGPLDSQCLALCEGQNSFLSFLPGREDSGGAGGEAWALGPWLRLGSFLVSTSPDVLALQPLAEAGVSVWVLPPPLPGSPCGCSRLCQALPWFLPFPASSKGFLQVP